MKAHIYLGPFLAVVVVALALLAATAGAHGVMAADAGDTGDAPHSLVYQDADDDGPEIGKLAFMTIGAAGIAAVIGLIGFAVRRAVGYEPHRPGPDDEALHH